MLALTLDEFGNLKFVVAEGESMAGDIPPTGNTNTHGLFKPNLKEFLRRWMKEGPTHHFALGVGHHAKEIEYIAEYFDITCAVISTQQ